MSMNRFTLFVLALALCIAVAGCALAPNSVRPEITHMSHVSQHFNGGNTHDSVNMLTLAAHWDLPHRFYVEVAEGVALNRPNGNGGFGEIAGPREEVTARIGYVFQVRR